MALPANTSFSWAPDALFTLDSTQFGTLINSLNGIMADPSFQAKIAEASTTLKVVQLHTLLNEVLEVAVEKGIAAQTPVEEPTN